MAFKFKCMHLTARDTQTELRASAGEGNSDNPECLAHAFEPLNTIKAGNSAENSENLL